MGTEDFVQISSGGQNVYGILHLPDGDPTHAIVYCSPFAEEQKSTYRVFVELARHLADKGVASLRFDYRGTGDSDGYFQDYLLEDWIGDTVAAIECLKEKSGLDRICVLGVRFGGFIGIQAAQQSESVSDLILWQPIISGKQFHRQEMRRFMIRQMMTSGKATKGEEELASDAEEENVIDMDGYLMRKELTEGIKETDLTSADTSVPDRTLLLQISHNDKVSKEYSTFLSNHADVELQTLICEPFWNRIGFVDTVSVFEITREWLFQPSDLT
ncbi:MAG: alpha/beta hydrolase [Planctomycetota bacterium]|jgi:exosortase A-associated hydrolase 2|nr:alpha/beta hydrolase [Planctomycetota bacterium]MDP7253408.1 alpha/beta hydrolase [Planctomycetota bacterium]